MRLRIALPRIPLIEDLTNAPIPSGTNILVEFDPASQWFNASLTIAAGWVKTGGSVNYVTLSQSPEDIRSHLSLFGLPVEELEGNDRLWIYDLYSASTGRKSKEKYFPESLKVADMSLSVARDSIAELPSPDFMVINDNGSILDRFNDERNWVEFYLTRPITMGKSRHLTQLMGFMSGVHSSWAYKQLEVAVDGIVDLKIEEQAGEIKNLMRIRSMRGVGYDSRWYSLRIGDNFEVTLEK